MKTRFAFFIFLSMQLFGATAPDFRGKNLDGKDVALKDLLKADRALLVTFWATWCTPCLEEIENLKRETAKDKSLALDIVAINVDTPETKSDVKPTVKMYKIPFEIISDSDHSIFSLYKKDKSLPFSVLISSQRQILETFSGFDESMMSKIQSKLTKRVN